MASGLNAVLKGWHPMLGRDLHLPWPPGAPAALPTPAPYITMSFLMGLVPLTTRFTTTVFTDGLAPTMIRGTDIGPMIPHMGPPSITLPLEILMSGSKSYFGVSALAVKDQYGAPGCVAAALLGFTNPNLNCGTPIPTPFGLVIAPTTHLVAMTLGDVIAGLYMMAWDFMLQAILYSAGQWAGEGMQRVVGVVAERLGVGALSRVAARQLARAQGIRSGIGPTANALRAARAAALASVADKTMIGVGLMAGSPLGISVSNMRDADGQQVFPSAYDRLAGAINPEQRGDELGKAVDDYFASPAVEDVPSTPDAGAEGTGAADADASTSTGGASTSEPKASMMDSAGDNSGAGASTSGSDASMMDSAGDNPAAGASSTEPDASMMNQGGPSSSPPDASSSGGANSGRSSDVSPGGDRNTSIPDRSPDDSSSDGGEP